MRLDAFLIADHATNAEGKLYVNGGGVTRLNVPMIPFALPSLSFVVRYLVEGEADYGTHQFGLRLETPSGINVLPEDTPMAVLDVQASPEAVEGEEQYVQLALGFSGLPAVEEGVHVVSTLVDGDVTGTYRLPVVVVGEPVAPPPSNRAARRRRARGARA